MGPVSGMEISLKPMGNENPMKRSDFCIFHEYNFRGCRVRKIFHTFHPPSSNWTHLVFGNSIF